MTDIKNILLLTLLSLFCIESQASDSIIIKKSKHFDIWYMQSSNEATIFIAGGSFRGKKKPKKKNLTFTHNLICRLEVMSENDTTFKSKTSAKSKRFLGIIRNSIYSLKFGSDAIPTEKLSKGKHRAMRKVIKEINQFYKPDPNSPPLPIRLIGSSYGSVVAAQFAIQVIEKNNGSIKAIILSASPIDSLSSDLGRILKHYENEGDIGKINWHPNPKDNVTGASGNTSLWKLIFPPFSSGRKSVLNPHHPHNVAAKNLQRSQEIIDFF